MMGLLYRSILEHFLWDLGHKSQIENILTFSGVGFAGGGGTSSTISMSESLFISPFAKPSDSEEDMLNTSFLPEGAV